MHIHESIPGRAAAIALAAGVCLALAAAPASAQPDLRLMCMGDSITNGTEPGGYRWPLFQRLDARGWSFDLVGRIQSNPGALTDPDHEGRNGIQITDTYYNGGGRLGREDRPGILDDLFWALELGFPTPAPTPGTLDVVLLHIGTNDFLQQVTINSDPGLIAEHAIDRLGDVLEAMRVQRPAVRVLLATIGPFTATWPNDPVTPELLSEVDEFNAALPGLVLAQRRAGQRIDLVNARAVLDDDNPLDANDEPYLADGLHPTVVGYDRLAGAWDAALERLLVEEGEISGCLADLNSSGTADFNDVALFISAFQAHEPSADLNHDGFVNFSDVSAFIASYQGC